MANPRDHLWVPTGLTQLGIEQLVGTREADSRFSLFSWLPC